MGGRKEASFSKINLLFSYPLRPVSSIRIDSLQHLGSSNQKLGFSPLVLGRGLEAKLEERYSYSTAGNIDDRTWGTGT